LFVFSSLQEARETLFDGDLLRAVAHAFNPSPEFSPQAIRAMVVNGNTQAETVLKAGDAEVLRLRTASWGVIANSIARQIISGTNVGTRKVLFSWGETTGEIDNIGKRSIQLQYTGASTLAKVTVDRVGLRIKLDTEEVLVTYEDCPTIEELVARLNGSGEFAVIQLDNEANVRSRELDHVEDIDIKTSHAVLTSDFFALFHALENSPWIGRGNITRNNDWPQKMPDNDPDLIFFEGATAGTFTVNDWNRTLAALETENIQIIGTHVTDHAVHTLISNHCTAMSNVQNRRERTALLGGPIGQTVDDAVEKAQFLNNSLVSYCYPSIRAASPLTGQPETLPASYFACKLLGMESSVAVNEPLTWKSVSVLEFLPKLRVSEMERLIRGGVLCGGARDDNRLAVIRAMTTHQGAQLQLVERSMVRIDLYMNRDIRMRYSRGVGRPGVSKAVDLEQTLQDAARAWAGEGLIVPTDEGLNIWGVVTRQEGDRFWISFHRNLTAPQNFFFITAFNHIYESATTVEI
jgi:hypothetical protein